MRLSYQRPRKHYSNLLLPCLPPLQTMGMQISKQFHSERVKLHVDSMEIISSYAYF
jgi:hypothetical protein